MVGPSKSEMDPDDCGIFEAWHTLPEDETNSLDAARLIEFATLYKAKWVVLDDFRVDETYQLALFEANLPSLLFNIRPDQPIWADIGVSTHLSSRKEMFASQLRNSRSLLLLGPDYAILRPIFQNVRLRPPCPSIKRVLIIFGGGDDRGAIRFALESILPVSEKHHELIVVSGSANRQIDILSNWIKQNGKERVVLYINPSDIASLFASCDLAIIAGGTTAYEVARCGVPMIVMPIVDNQVFHARGFFEQGAMLVSGFPGEVARANLRAAFELMKRDCNLREQIAYRMRHLVDGKGAERIAALLCRHSNQDDGSPPAFAN